MTYSEKLKDPRWQKMRLKILDRDSWTCQACGDTTKTLHVHHVYYPVDEDCEPWEAGEGSLVVLCADCHQAEPESHRHAVQYLLMCLTDAGIRTAEQLQMVTDYAPDEAWKYKQAGDTHEMAFAKALCNGISAAVKTIADGRKNYSEKRS